jgi:hypothetical protein
VVVAEEVTERGERDWRREEEKLGKKLIFFLTLASNFFSFNA